MHPLLYDVSRAVAPILRNVVNVRASCSDINIAAGHIGHDIGPSSRTMLPPVDLAITDRNPHFKALWNDLSTTRLNPDGTSRVVRKQKQQDDIRKVSLLQYLFLSVRLQLVKLRLSRA